MRVIYFLTVFVGAITFYGVAMGVPVDSLAGRKIITATDMRSFHQLAIANSNIQSDPIIIRHETFADSTEYYRSKALEYDQDVTSRQAYVKNLTPLLLLDLPVGLTKDGADLNYKIIITSVKVSPPYGSSLEAYFLFELPSTGDKIAFRGTNIKFSKDGGLSGISRLDLIGSYPIKLNDQTLFTILGKGNTYVEFDCNGFKGMGIEGEVEFSRDLIVPEDAKGNILPDPQRVKTRFATYVQSWNDIMLGVNIPPFQVNGLNGVGFSVSQAFLDWSDLANPTGMIFPSGYNDAYKGLPLWRGFYMKRLNVSLPPSFTKSRTDSSRLSFGVEDMILDDMGFTGAVYGEKVLEAGSMNGWAYSIDKVAIDLIANSVKGFELDGKISVPRLKPMKSDSAVWFSYLAQRSTTGVYTFAVKLDNTLKFPALFADLTLYKGSTVVVKDNNGALYPSCILNGEITIDNIVKGPKAQLMGIRFEQLVLNSQEPHFSIGAVGLGNESQTSSVSKFPVVFNNIMVKTAKDKIGLGFDLSINISGSAADEGFSGTGSLTVWGKKDSVQVISHDGQIVNEDDNWSFDKIEISGIGISIKKPGAIEMAGTIKFFDSDPVYGDGFKGSLKGKISTVTVQADALFGKTPTYRYWFADALVRLQSGIPIIPGVVSAFGFGGGFYYKMKQSTAPAANTIGQTQSHLTYIPDEKTFGIRAIMQIGTPRPEAMSGDVALEVSINDHGGINSVTFTGNANFMSFAAMANDEIQDLAGSAVGGTLSTKLSSMLKGQVYGTMKLQYDNVNSVFHGTLDVYVSVAGGVVRGIGTGNKAGWAVIHFEQDDWYIFIGTPDQPIGLEVAKIFKTQSYLMLGKNLPGSPAPPQQVSDILGNVSFDYMRDLNALQSGTGFAFGMYFGVDTGDLKFLMFYGRFSAGTGVDFMLKDYGKDCHCNGSSDPIGIDGWYANGQAYAFVMGKIGIHVNLRFYHGNFDILSIGAAAILQMKAPNPFWMKGAVGGYYKILGGLVKGQCNFDVTLGTDCQIVIPQQDVNPLQDIKIISALNPVDGEKDVDVFTSPQAAFNIPIEQVFDVTDDNSQRKVFRARLESFDITGTNGPVTGSIQWNDTKDVAAFESFDVLPPNQQLKATVKVVFEENSDGSWHTATFQGSPSEETQTVTFTTGAAPDYIPPSNVDISYPAVGQFNFYPKEYDQGFVILKKGQGYLFAPGQDWIQKLHFTDAATKSYFETDVTYTEAEKKVSFSIASGFQNAKAYSLDVLNFPKQTQLVGQNVKSVETNVSTNSTGNDVTVTTKALDGNVQLAGVKTIYSSLFRTSMFNTFSDKVNSLKLSFTFSENIGVNVFQLASYVLGKELFDNAEINERFTDREIQFEAALDQNDWYKNNVYPLVYNGYPLLGFMTIKQRDITQFGFPPTRSAYIDQEGYYPVLTQDNLTAAFSPPSQFNSVRYDLMVPMLQDYKDIQNQVANYVVDNNMSSIPDQFTRLLTTSFPVFTPGKYQMQIKYVIPRINKTTSQYTWELKYGN